MPSIPGSPITSIIGSWVISDVGLYKRAQERQPVKPVTGLLGYCLTTAVMEKSDCKHGLFSEVPRQFFFQRLVFLSDGAFHKVPTSFTGPCFVQSICALA